MNLDITPSRTGQQQRDNCALFGCGEAETIQRVYSGDSKKIANQELQRHTPVPKSSNQRLPVFPSAQHLTERNRKGTVNSCELALFECPSQSDREQSNSGEGLRLSEVRRNIIFNIREELLQFTEPDLYRLKMEKLRKETEIDSFNEEIIEEDEFLDDDEMDRLLLGDDDDFKPPYLSKKTDAEEYQLGKKRFTTMRQMHVFNRPTLNDKHIPHSTSMMGKIGQQKTVSAEGINFGSGSEAKMGHLRIHIEKDSMSPNTTLILNESPEKVNSKQNENAIQVSNSCGKQTQNTFFQGLGHGGTVNHHINITASNSPKRKKLREKFASGQVGHNSMQNMVDSGIFPKNHNEYMHNIFYPNKQTLAVGNEASHNPLNKSSDTVSQYRYEAMSPMSSNIGSFYYDRLEEFLPEKKVVAEKKLIRMQSKYFHLDQPKGAEGEEVDHSIIDKRTVLRPTIYEKETPRAPDTVTPLNKDLQAQRPYRVAGYSTSSITKSQYQYARLFKRLTPKQEPTLMQKKAMLRESLTKYKNTKAERKDKMRLNTAQALKYLRKLGRKLRNPVFKKVPINRFGSSSSPFGSSNLSPNRGGIAHVKNNINSGSRKPSDSPPKSMMSHDDFNSSKNVSPRIQLMNHQKMLNIQKQNSLNQVAQSSHAKSKEGTTPFCFHLTVAQEDKASSAEFRKSQEGSSSVNALTPPEVTENDCNIQQFKKMGTMEGETEGLNHSRKRPNESDMNLPVFRVSGTFSFEVSNFLDPKLLDNQNHQVSSFKPPSNNSNHGKPLRPQGSFNSGRGSNFNLNTPQKNLQVVDKSSKADFEHANRQFSFASDILMSAYHEIAQLSSPVMCRNQVQPELDETEEFVMDALQEYRTVEHYKEFKNYQKYYEDANMQNLALTMERAGKRGSSRHLLTRQPSIKHSDRNLQITIIPPNNQSVSDIHLVQSTTDGAQQPSQGNGSGTNNQTFQSVVGEDIFSQNQTNARDRFQYVSFKDPRYFNQQQHISHEQYKWQEQVTHFLMMDQQNPIIEEERKEETFETDGDQENSEQLRIIQNSTSHEDINPDMERQVSNQDQNPWIDQSQPAPLTREPSLHKSEKKSTISHRKINKNIKQLAEMLEDEVPTPGKSRQPMHNRALDRVMSQNNNKQEFSSEYQASDEQRATHACLSGERGHIRESSCSRDGSNLKIATISKGKLTTTQGNMVFTSLNSPHSKEHQWGFFEDKKALKRLNHNLKSLFQEIERRPPSPPEKLLNQRILESTVKKYSTVASPRHGEQIMPLFNATLPKQGALQAEHFTQLLQQLGRSFRDTARPESSPKAETFLIQPVTQGASPVLFSPPGQSSIQDPHVNGKKARQQPKQRQQEQHVQNAMNPMRQSATNQGNMRTQTNHPMVQLSFGFNNPAKPKEQSILNLRAMEQPSTDSNNNAVLGGMRGPNNAGGNINQQSATKRYQEDTDAMNKKR